MFIRSRTVVRHAGRACLALGLALVAAHVAAPAASAQWSRTYDQFYLPGEFNWQFRHNYPAADRLFNAFDFGHAILYETLWTKPNAPASELEQRWYDRLTKEILVHPPRVPLEEAAIEVAFAKLVPEAKQMLDWAHLLHRQIYDVWADERIPLERKDAEIAALLRYYRSRPDVAFSSRPKNMELMEGQPYSLAFRQRYPKFNGLIWAYHWLQIGLYEPLLTGKTLDERQTGVLAAVGRFRQMLHDPPDSMPRIMPMTAAVAPAFADRYAEAAIIFDNLHSMHDVISDILANPIVPRNRKREEILRAASRYRDATSFVMTDAEWRDMAVMMGVQNMGGPAVGFLAALPEGTVARGAVHQPGMDHSKMGMQNMLGMEHGKMQGGDSAKMGAMGQRKMAGMDSSRMAGMQHGQMPAQAMQHGAMGHAAADSVKGDSSGRAARMMEMHLRMMRDPVIRKRMMADTTLRRMMDEMMSEMPPEHRAHMDSMMREETPASKKAAAPRRGAAKKPPAVRGDKPTAKPTAKPATKPAAKPADPHADHGAPAKPAPKRPAGTDSMPDME